jgi:GntR family transcriptional regulator
MRMRGLAGVGATGSASDAMQRTTNGAPLYHTTYLVLRSKIIDGILPPDAPMPPEIELARQFGVSRITMRRALDELRIEGLIVRRAGRGTFVAPAPVDPPGVVERIESDLIENLVALGLKSKVRVLEFGYLVPPLSIARMLEISPGLVAQRAVRVRSYQGKPFAYLTTYIPEEFGRSFTRIELANNLLLALLERAGAKAHSAEQTISATAADPETAAAIETSVGEPLLAITRLVRDQANRPVQYLRALYRPDLYRYRMTMQRVNVPEAAIWAPSRVASLGDFRGRSVKKRE